MLKRLLFGPVMIALLLGALWLDHHVVSYALPGWATGILPTGWSSGHWPPGTIMLPVIIALVVLAAREMAGLLESAGIEDSKRMATFAAITGLVVSCMVPGTFSAVTSAAIVASAAIVVLVFAMAFYSRHKSVEGVIAATGGVLLSFVYLGLMTGFLLAIRREHEVIVLGWIILMVKACDIGAYFTGKAIGRRKLIPWLSPGKTWEGLAGGVVLSAVVGTLGAHLVARATGQLVPAWWMCAIIGGTLGIVGQAGDLLESLLKRDAGKKDSGGSVPGFGGILDVLDSPLLAAPVAFWWLRLMVERGYFV
jgi:phosphatidate cytidylyltransferase